MNSIWKKLQEQAGFVSMETIMTGSMVIALGAWGIYNLYQSSDGIISRSMNELTQMMEIIIS